MIAAGIDLGGTKIEAQKFDADWERIEKKRVPTPKDYPTLLKTVAEMIAWCGPVPVGIAAAGLIHPTTGLAITANLSASGKPFPKDVSKAAGRKVLWVNDARALILSEAVFGAGEGKRRVAGLILGTGVGGGVAVDKKLLVGPSSIAGEVGHGSLPANIVTRHNLPVIKCGCGRTGCVETLVSGPGLVRLAKFFGEMEDHPASIANARGKAWKVWCALTAELIFSGLLVADPDLIVLAGGLSNIPHLIEDLNAALLVTQWDGFPIPDIKKAEGGDTAGAMGAAYAAWSAAARNG